MHFTNDSKGRIGTHFPGYKSQTQDYDNLLCGSREDKQDRLVNIGGQIFQFKIVKGQGSLLTIYVFSGPNRISETL